MSHQPFENWLFSEEPLDSEQQHLMNTHLEECEYCRSLAKALDQVEGMLSSQVTPDPLPGFVQRWQDRLVVVRQGQRYQKTWLLTLALFGIAGLIILSVLLLNLNTVNWSYQLGQFIASFSLLAARVNQFLNAFTSITEAFPLLIPVLLIAAFGLVTAVAALIVIWIGSLFRLYKPLQKGVVVS